VGLDRSGTPEVEIAFMAEPYNSMVFSISFVSSTQTDPLHCIPFKCGRNNLVGFANDQANAGIKATAKISDNFLTTLAPYA